MLSANPDILMSLSDITCSCTIVVCPTELLVITLAESNVMCKAVAAKQEVGVTDFQKCDVNFWANMWAQASCLYEFENMLLYSDEEKWIIC